ncbi:glutathionylspermidine synthase family protein [Methylobacterium isbiliense]|uniref:Acid--amine ligase YgiC n=1 Tax=Methylobacterium isbiliense TaxID=315478 RepID=A0ABQ4SD68_9HYPH|nr:glutathionylspermidine synthase family protein [Methylobacterium isbiliense]MDN3625156.1 glutathionylspermidine synthase family protein [Methylobacterium isbiliense]GJE00430.1 Putative acid--amine ligase YgiC [Methylobacterium isbiliense]
MRRRDLGERPDWRAQAEAAGFSFHTLDGAPYWDESHAYAFSLDQIERDIEAPSAEIHALCLAFVDRAVADDRILASLAIPPHAFAAVRDSWLRRDPSLYGRLDFAYDGSGPAKLLEYNADTPTALYETGVFQWLWLEDGLARGRLPAGTDQFNSVHERLVARFGEIRGPVAFTCLADALEDRGTVAYLQDCAHQAGLATRFVPLDAVSVREDGAFADRLGAALGTLFKLYPWEWAFRDPFGQRLSATPTRFLEPPWKAVLSNKGLLAHLWAMEPGHPNLLPAYFEDDPAKAALGTSFVKKPILSREGANVLMVRDGAVVAREDGPYGGEGFVRQALADLAAFGEQRVLLGSWIVGNEPAGLCLRESPGLITGNRARFVPHVIAP